MGQYHILAHLDKREIVVPHALGLGLKQREHLAEPGYPLSGSMSDALYFLTMTSPARGGGDFRQVSISGRWAGDRCVVLGDYTEDLDLPDFPNASNIYYESVEGKNGWTDISDIVARDMGEVFNFHMEGDGWKHRVDGPPSMVVS